MGVCVGYIKKNIGQSNSLFLPIERSLRSLVWGMVSLTAVEHDFIAGLCSEGRMLDAVCAWKAQMNLYLVFHLQLLTILQTWAGLGLENSVIQLYHYLNFTNP